MKREYVWPEMSRKADNIWVKCPRCKTMHKYAIYLENNAYQHASTIRCKQCTRPITVMVEVKYEALKDIIDLQNEGVIGR